MEGGRGGMAARKNNNEGMGKKCKKWKNAL